MYCSFLRRNVYFTVREGVRDIEGVGAGKIVFKRSIRQAWRETTEGARLRKVKVLAATLAMTLMAAAPAMADTAIAGPAVAQSEFFGGDFAAVPGATAQSQFFGGDFAAAPGVTAQSQFFGGDFATAPGVVAQSQFFD